ncbi:MAG: hypothetical protein ACI3VX_02515 [Faecousia sp.]
MQGKTDRAICGTCRGSTGNHKPAFGKYGVPKDNITFSIIEIVGAERRVTCATKDMAQAACEKVKGCKKMKKGFLRIVGLSVLMCLILILCACSSQADRYNDLIVGYWQAEGDSDILAFYYSGIGRQDVDLPWTEFHWKIAGNEMTWYNDYVEMTLTIKVLDEEQLVIAYEENGRVEEQRYCRVSSQMVTPEGAYD